MDIPFEILLDFLDETSKGVFISILVKPGAKKEKISLNAEGNLTLSVAAQPVENAANDRVRQLLAGLFQIPKSSVIVHSGHASRQKLIRIEGIGIEEIKKRGRSDRI